MKAQHPITIFEAITKQRVAGVWNISLALTQRAQTLDYYYRIYQALLEFEPERKRGYRERICYNLQICSELWGGVSKVWNVPRYRYSQARRCRNGETGMDLSLNDILGFLGVALFWLLGLYLYGKGKDFRKRH